MIRYVSVIGPGDGATQRDCEDALTGGRLLAEHGVAVITGGLGGVMAAASEGASQASGLSVGILPGHDRSDGNQHQTIALPTGLGEMRNGLVVRCADALIVIGGSWGTLNELALAQRTGTPVVSLRGWVVSDDGGSVISIESVDSAEAAVARVLTITADLD